MPTKRKNNSVAKTTIRIKHKTKTAGIAPSAVLAAAPQVLDVATKAVPLIEKGVSAIVNLAKKASIGPDRASAIKQMETENNGNPYKRNPHFMNALKKGEITVNTVADWYRFRREKNKIRKDEYQFFSKRGWPLIEIENTEVYPGYHRNAGYEANNPALKLTEPKGFKPVGAGFHHSVAKQTLDDWILA